MSEPISLSSPSGPGNPRDGDQYREYYIPIRSVEEEQEYWKNTKRIDSPTLCGKSTMNFI